MFMKTSHTMAKRRFFHQSAFLQNPGTSLVHHVCVTGSPASSPDLYHIKSFLEDKVEPPVAAIWNKGGEWPDDVMTPTLHAREVAIFLWEFSLLKTLVHVLYFTLSFEESLIIGKYIFATRSLSTFMEQSQSWRRTCTLPYFRSLLHNISAQFINLKKEFALIAMP